MPAESGFDKRLAAAIAAAGLNKKQLSEKAGVSRPAIDAWLAGSIPVQDAPVRQMASVLGVDFQQLWGIAADLRPDERTRLMQLESAFRRVRAILEEIEPADAADDFPSSAEYAERFDEPTPAQQRPRRRRGKSA